MSHHGTPRGLNAAAMKSTNRVDKSLLLGTDAGAADEMVRREMSARRMVVIGRCMMVVDMGAIDREHCIDA